MHCIYIILYDFICINWSYILWKGWPRDDPGMTPWIPTGMFLWPNGSQRFPDPRWVQLSSWAQLGADPRGFTQGHPPVSSSDWDCHGHSSQVFGEMVLGQWIAACFFHKTVFCTSFSSGSMNYPRTCSALSMFRFGWHNVFQRCWPRPSEMIIDYDLTRCSLPFFELSSDCGAPHTIDANMLS